MNGRRTGRALLVGVSRYASVDDLPQAVRSDVQDLKALLQDAGTCGLAPASVGALLDGEATADKLRRKLRDMAAVSTEEELFLFYFSGHGHRKTVGGTERTWLLPHDADLTDLDRTALSADELRDIMGAVVSKRQVILVDACHAGGLGAAKSTGPHPAGFAKSGVDALAAGAGRALLSSSRADEKSLILQGERNSVFTAALLEALRGAATDRGDGLVGVLDVFEYVSRTVPARADQHPVLRADDLEGNFPLARRSTSITMPKPGSAPEDAAKLLATLYPAGPTQDQIWARSGGDVARLALGGNGLAQWHSALSKIALGGGGTTMARLLLAVGEDYPDNADLERLTATAR